MEFTGYTKFRIPQATVCSEQSTHIGGAQQGAQASVQAGAQSGYQGFPGGSDSKESPCNVGDLGSIPGMERYPGEGNGNPLQYPCLENPYGQKSLGSYSPWGPKEKDTTG